jgi:hypothetical protein
LENASLSLAISQSPGHPRGSSPQGKFALFTLFSSDFNPNTAFFFRRTPAELVLLRRCSRLPCSSASGQPSPPIGPMWRSR